jgi:uncharacterized membrane protein YwzB
MCNTAERKSVVLPICRAMQRSGNGAHGNQSCTGERAERNTSRWQAAIRLMEGRGDKMFIIFVIYAMICCLAVLWWAVHCIKTAPIYKNSLLQRFKYRRCIRLFLNILWSWRAWLIETLTPLIVNGLPKIFKR